MDVINLQMYLKTNLEDSDNISFSKSISTILSIVKETMKKVKEIDRQVRKLSIETNKNITPYSGVEIVLLPAKHGLLYQFLNLL